MEKYRCLFDTDVLYILEEMGSVNIVFPSHFSSVPYSQSLPI